MADDPLPALRASDADRERTAELLRHAAGEGRLTVEELEERLNTVYETRTQRELETLVADVVTPGEAANDSRVRVRRSGDAGTRWLVSVMSGHDRKGSWRVGSSLNVINVMGGSDLDFNDAEFADDVVTVTVFSLMGGAEIRVPDGLNVEVSNFAFMGGNDVDIGAGRPDPGGPVLRLKLISIMGGSDVKRGRRRSRAERRELRRRRRL
ncbi:DUF1707 SHOCT-like domain-containing protein [Candidatus Solirubrobacter pratensis]|uniref:DUF1707 SHOCT-like domain-containing protein n=1 Tax=Candidatus Solirubrobacter pratensis TaxID=1298857 RepID=UPI00041C3D39|nr:DUF1707 domain-containing protein [Candidatus Solirubrobacter pratensis]